ncbi:IQ domain-containing protein C-like isoform X2 [Polypterus senegalus]|uniref:IQ domain-containing protein C-like isoform X2 n=1 Tax=Polypterus senegalus TaxID=55291 RepID=UPI001962856E|nr:IQ domain-containing protein C-like isoform X2 [Polypterus senegalus]
MEPRDLVDKIILLQAQIRGFLVRRKFSSVYEEYEQIVREIEGDQSHLEWCGFTLMRPVFVSKKCEKSKSHKPEVKVSAVGVQNCKEYEPQQQQQQQQQEDEEEQLMPEREGSIHRLPTQLVSEHLEEEKQGPDTASSDAGALKPSSESPRLSDLTSSMEDARVSQSFTDVTSLWDSNESRMSSSAIHRDSFCRSLNSSIPNSLEGLQQYKTNLAMELIWLQQAIASRKKYLMLKKGLGNLQ